MALFENFPYTNLHELNLDYILETQKKQEEAFDNVIEEATELKNETGLLKDQTQTLKNETSDLKDQTQTLKDETSDLKDQTQTLKDETQAIKDTMSDHLDQIDTNTQNILVNSARIDTFTNLAEGSTSGDAELTDIRVGANGVTYSTAGDAVRDQIEMLNDSSVFFTSDWTDGYYYHNTEGVTPNASYSITGEIPIPAGANIIVYTAITGNACIAIFNSNYQLIKTVTTSSFSPTAYNVETPLSAAYMIVSCLVANKSTFYWHLKDLGTLKDVQDNASNIYSPVAPYDIKNGFINCTNGEYTANDNYRTYYYKVSPGDVLKINAAAAPGGALGLAVFYNNTSYVGYYGINKTGDFVTYSNELVTVPANTNVVAITFRIISAIPQVYTKIFELTVNKPMLAVYDSTTKNLSFKFKRTPAEDLIIEMGVVNYGNNLFDFKSIKALANTGDLTPIMTGSDVLTNATDFFSPYRVQALEDIDGDLPEGYENNFTGGAHQYNNMTTGSTKTARLDYVKVLFDGMPATEKMTACNEIYVEWCNYIQGNNTMKADGTGREILKEIWTAKITRNCIEVNNKITPLEGVKILRYYGISTYINNSSKFRFIGGEERGVVSSPANSGNKTANGIESSKTGLAIRMLLDNDFDLGHLQYSTNTYNLFASGQKAYSWLINDESEFTAGDILELRGTYNFVDQF